MWGCIVVVLFSLLAYGWVLVIGGGLLVFYYVLVDWYEGFLNFNIMILVIFQGISLMVCDSVVALAATLITMSGVAFHFF